jgi:hypothetical protein
MLSFPDDSVSFGFQALHLHRDTTGVFFVEDAVCFQCAPVRSDASLWFSRGFFFSSMRGDPGKDSGSQRTGQGTAKLQIWPSVFRWSVCAALT